MVHIEPKFVLFAFRWFWGFTLRDGRSWRRKRAHRAGGAVAAAVFTTITQQRRESRRELAATRYRSSLSSATARCGGGDRRGDLRAQVEANPPVGDRRPSDAPRRDRQDASSGTRSAGYRCSGR